MKKLSILFLAALFLVGCKENKVNKTDEPEDPKAVNVIYMIGDGMALPQIYAAMLATGDDLAFSEFPYTGVVTTRSASNDITDSAAGGTALACDQKTKNGMVGMDVDSVAMPTVLEILADHGKKTGIVVTCYATHATPADFYAKVPNRNMYEEIAEQMMNHEGLNLMIGGGRKHFNQRKDGRNLLEEMAEKGWTVYDTLDNIDVTDKRYAVFADDNHMPMAAQRGDFLPRGVKTALETLDGSEDGFFLMVEGSQIDFACHNNDSTYMVDEMLDFNAAVQIALDYAKSHDNTLVVVTADHETGGLTMIDPQGHYADVSLRYSTWSHTCLPVMVFAYGPGAEQFTGWMQNCDLKAKILNACGIEAPKAEAAEPHMHIEAIKANYDSGLNK